MGQSGGSARVFVDRCVGASKIKFLCAMSFICVMCALLGEATDVDQARKQARKQWCKRRDGCGCSSVTHTGTRIHRHRHKSRTVTVQLSSCCDPLCCAVLCERSIGPLCSGVHGKQGPVGRCLARRRHVAMQPSPARPWSCQIQI